MTDERLEGLQLNVERLPTEKRSSISAEALEHRDGTDGQAPERRQVRLRTGTNRRVPAAEFRQGVGVQQDRFSVRHGASVPSP